MDKVIQELKEAEHSVLQQMNNFQSLFMAVNTLKSQLETHPAAADNETAATLDAVLKSKRHIKQSKCFFLFRETATTLISIIASSSDIKLKQICLSVLKNNINGLSRDPLRAVAEAAGSLPMGIYPPKPPDFNLSDIPVVSVSEIIKITGIKKFCNHRWTGRSLVSDIDNNRLLIFKMAKPDDSLKDMNMEGWFMTFFRTDFQTEMKFNIPSPVKISTHFILDLKDLPQGIERHPSCHAKNICIAYIADKDYFIYPNEKESDCNINEAEFLEMISRNSRLLGELTGKGLVHTAPIPLFHNRVQQGRRNDNGIYLWDKGGRLDKWLESCRYPNFGESGIRDFEHIELFNGDSKRLYKQIGSHILSLFLVTGSFFRNIGKDNGDHSLVGKSGFDNSGNPIDARSLFDDAFLKKILELILLNYYQGFTGMEPLDDFTFDAAELSKQIISEMGVDKHMEEIFRVADQNEMSDDAFENFLMDRGINKRNRAAFKKGQNDIITNTGPHLGGFNQKFSIPEMTDLFAVISSFCIIDRFTANDIS